MLNATEWHDNLPPKRMTQAYESQKGVTLKGVSNLKYQDIIFKELYFPVKTLDLGSILSTKKLLIFRFHKIFDVVFKVCSFQRTFRKICQLN